MWSIFDLHFHGGHFDSPIVGGFIEVLLQEGKNTHLHVIQERAVKTVTAELASFPVSPSQLFVGCCHKKAERELGTAELSTHCDTIT